MHLLRLHNSLTRQLQEFIPIDPNHIKMYVCGPTVYDRPHLGNARSVVIYDVLYRLLKSQYPKVTYVRNITDVDDKINKAAKENGETIKALSTRVTGWFHEDMAALGCLPPTLEPRATENIDAMLRMIEKLIKNGNAYIAAGHVLFDVTSDAEYGILSGRAAEEQQAGARIAVEGYKKNPGDFVLWKPADNEDDESSKFPSPWGVGRPGWHIECSAMATKILGENFDIHGGGADLMFPHHENEIAQSCSANPGSHYAKFWVHNGFLTVNGEKMSKSLGNFITVKDLLDRGVKGEVIRYALLSSHYRSPLDWTEKLLEDSKKAMDGFYRVCHPEPREGSGARRDPSPLAQDDLVNKLNNDLNISVFLAEAHEIKNPMVLKQALNLLGLLQHSPEEWFKGGGKEDNIEIQNLINERLTAKKSRDFKKADEIRNKLVSMGIILEDRPDGTTDWRRV